MPLKTKRKSKKKQEEKEKKKEGKPTPVPLLPFQENFTNAPYQDVKKMWRALPVTCVLYSKLINVLPLVGRALYL